MQTIKTSNGLTLTYVHTDRQFKNGTIVLRLETADGPVDFLSYASGYVRRTASRGGRLHYINRRVKDRVDIKVTHVNSAGEIIHGMTRESYTISVPKLIPTELDRLAYILRFADRNFATTVVNKRFAGEIKHLRNEFSNVWSELVRAKSELNEYSPKWNY